MITLARILKDAQACEEWRERLKRVKDLRAAHRLFVRLATSDNSFEVCRAATMLNAFFMGKVSFCTSGRERHPKHMDNHAFTGTYQYLEDYACLPLGILLKMRESLS